MFVDVTLCNSFAAWTMLKSYGGGYGSNKILKILITIVKLVKIVKIQPFKIFGSIYLRPRFDSHISDIFPPVWLLAILAMAKKKKPPRIEGPPEPQDLFNWRPLLDPVGKCQCVNKINKAHIVFSTKAPGLA